MFQVQPGIDKVDRSLQLISISDQRFGFMVTEKEWFFLPLAIEIESERTKRKEMRDFVRRDD